MDRNTLEALENALNASPDNAILREQTAKGYFNLGDYEKAKEHYNILLQNTRDSATKLMLAKCYYHLGNCSPGLVICEDLLSNEKQPPTMSLYIQLLVKDNQLGEAVNQYQKLQTELPGWRDEELEKQLKIPNYSSEGGDVEMDNEFLEKPDINFSKVGGMDEVKEEIRIKIIHPIKNADLFKAFGKKAGGGILMYGPPGCGKTHLARATAGEIDSKFISVGLEEILDMWMGNSEKNLHEKFELARRNAPCVLFFDEIDALGSKRNDLRQSAGRNLINQFLKEMDGIDTKNDGVLILGATNSPWHMDSAFLRPGRFDRIIFVPPPDTHARKQILELQLEGKPIQKIDHKKIADNAKDFSGADIKMLVDMAVEEKLRQSMSSGKVEALTTKDILKFTGKVRASTKEWFNTARNYALYSNSSGMYNDILSYLKL